MNFAVEQPASQGPTGPTGPGGGPSGPTGPIGATGPTGATEPRDQQAESLGSTRRPLLRISRRPLP